MSVISLTTSPMRAAASSSSLTAILVRPASFTALVAMAFDCATWRSISFTDADNSSAAEAMSRTFEEASDEAAVALAVLTDASSAEAASWLDASSI